MISTAQLKEFICKADPESTFIKGLDGSLVGLKNAIEAELIVPAYDMDLAIENLCEIHDISENTAIKMIIDMVDDLPKDRRPCFITYFRNPQELIEIGDEENTLEFIDKLLEDFENDLIKKLQEKITKLSQQISMQNAIIQEHVLKDFDATVKE